MSKDHLFPFAKSPSSYHVMDPARGSMSIEHEPLHGTENLVLEAEVGEADQASEVDPEQADEEDVAHADEVDVEATKPLYNEHTKSALEFA